MSDALTASLTSHGRHDFRRGCPFNPMAASSWRDGWAKEAHLLALAHISPQMATAMALIAAQDALEAAQRVFDHCTVSRPTRTQQGIMDQAGPLIAEALAQLQRAAHEVDGDEQNPGVAAG